MHIQNWTKILSKLGLQKFLSLFYLGHIEMESSRTYSKSLQDQFVSLFFYSLQRNLPQSKYTNNVFVLDEDFITSKDTKNIFK